MLRSAGGVWAACVHHPEPPGALFSVESTGRGGARPGNNRGKTTTIREMLILLIFVLCVSLCVCVYACKCVTVCVCMCV